MVLVYLLIRWSYQLAIAEGYAPTDPRDSVGACAALGKSSLFDGVYSAWMTGGVSVILFFLPWGNLVN